MRSVATPLPRADDHVRPGPGVPAELGTGGISGGHRYHQHLLAAAADAGFAMWVARPGIGRKLPAADVVVIDSLYAWRLVGAVRRSPRPLAVAIVRQLPAGPTARLVAAAPSALDLATYRAYDLVVTTGPIWRKACSSPVPARPDRVEVVEPGCDLPAAGTSRPCGPGASRTAQRRRLVAQQRDSRAARRRRALPGDTVTLSSRGSHRCRSHIRRRPPASGRTPDLVDRVVVHGPAPRPAVASLYTAADRSRSEPSRDVRQRCRSGARRRVAGRRVAYRPRVRPGGRRGRGTTRHTWAGRSADGRDPPPRRRSRRPAKAGRRRPTTRRPTTHLAPDDRPILRCALPADGRTG